MKEIITAHESRILGPAGTKHTFPSTLEKNGKVYPLDLIGPKSAGRTEKIYAAGKVKKGEAALTLNNGQLVYKLFFPVNRVPYLGIWINEGGFKGEYNCALEPSTGYYDSLEVTKRLDSL